MCSDAGKPERSAFAVRQRNPVTVVLDGVAGNYNIGAIFRLCGAFLVERLVICGTVTTLRNRRLVQAAEDKKDRSKGFKRAFSDVKQR